MAYSAVFNVSSSIDFIQPEKASSEDVRSTWSEPVKAVDDTTVRFSTLPFVPSIVSAFPETMTFSRGRKKPRGQPEKEKEGAREADVYQKPNAEDAGEPNRTEDGSRSRGDRFGFCRCRRDMLPVKMFYFSFMGALGVILPYSAVFLKQNGLGPFQIGVISGARPALGFVSAPVWGSLADRFNLRRSMMLVSMVAWLAFFLGFYLLEAPSRLRGPYPVHPSLHRSHVRFRRSAITTKTGDVIDDVVDNVTSDVTASSALFLEAGNLGAGNFSSCNYSHVDRDDRELLRENLFWIYEPSEVHLKFVVCLLIICGGELFQAPTTALTDAATLQLLGRDNIGHYGAQRAWGPIGWAISSLVVGSLLNASRWRETICGIHVVFSDYRVIAYVFVVVMVFGLIAGYNINFSSSKEEQNGNRKSMNRVHDTMAVVKLFLNVHYGSWILTAFYVGLLNGVIWGFLFWHLDNLGGTQLLMGIDAVVMSVFEFAAFFLVDHVIKRIGHMGIMYVGLIGYSVRFVIYASLSNPWFVLPADVLQGVTFSFIWVSLTAYTAIAVPSVSLGTVQGIVHGVYFGLGNGLGHLIGGVLIGYYGAVATFYAFAASTVLWLVLFILCQKFSKKPSFDQFSYQDISGPDATTSAHDRRCDTTQ